MVLARSREAGAAFRRGLGPARAGRKLRPLTFVKLTMTEEYGSLVLRREVRRTTPMETTMPKDATRVREIERAEQERQGARVQ